MKDRPKPTGDAVYRVLIPKEKLEHDEKALEFVEA